MRYFLLIVGSLMWVAGAFSVVVGDTSNQEVFGAICGSSGSVLIAGGCIVAAVQDTPRNVKRDEDLIAANVRSRAAT